MVLLAALALGPFASPVFQTSTPKLTARVLPTITGRNGYEEFVQAAEIIDGPVFRFYTTVTPGTPVELPENPQLAALAKRLGQMSFIEVRRDVVQKFGSALELVRRGNRKEVYDPRTDIRPETEFPELVDFKGIARLFVYDSYIKFADGNPAAGTQSLLDGLEFSYNISGGSIISSLVGVACSSIVMAAIEERLAMFSLADCRRARELAHEALHAPRQLSKALVAERKAATNALDEIFSDPERLYQLVRDSDKAAIEREKQVVYALKTKPAADRERYRKDVQEAIDQHYLTVTELLKRPEYQWFGTEVDPLTALSGGSDPVSKMLVQSVLSTTSQILLTEARLRTQFRLLALHAAVLEFKWKNGKFPKNLAEAVASDETYDPLSNKPFQFEPRSDVYRLYSF